MGVKKFYVLTTGDRHYTGPAAYHKLMALRAETLAYNPKRRVPIEQPELPTKGGWRKRIELVYKGLAGQVVPEGALRTFTARRGRSYQNYRDILYWINAI